MNYQFCNLGDLADIGRGSSPRPITDTRYFQGGNIPWIKIADATSSGKFIYETKEHVNDFGASFSRKLQKGSLIIAASGTLGFPKFLGVEGCIHDGWMYFENFKLDKINPDYLYYALITLRSYFNNLSYGAAIQNINTPILKKTRIALPSLKVQNRIASILSAYDDLIEKNNRKIAILQEMAEEIYKEWFVRRKANQWPIVKMREFGYQAESGKRPKGGIDDSLSEGVPSLGAEVIDKLGMFDFSNVKLVPEEFYQSMKKGIGKDKDILLYKDGAYIGKVTLFMDNFPYEKYAVNEHVFLIRANNKLYQYYLYFTLNQQQYFTQMQNLNRNAAQPGLTPSDIDIVKLCKPDEEIIKKFNRVVEPMLHSIFTIAKQNNILKTQRDLLLPRLMSGKLEVKA